MIGLTLLKVTGASSGFRSGSVGTYGSGGPSTDEAALSAYITKEWPSLSTTSAHDVVIVYTKNIYHDNGGGFFTDNAYGYTLYPSLAKKLGVRTLSVIASERDLHTAAHEVLHVLLDDLHPPAKGGKHDVEFSYSRRLWSGGGIPGLGGGDADAYTDRKRMSKTVPDYVIPGVPGSPGILNSSFVQPPTTTP